MIRPGRFRFADYALFERDPTPPDAWLAARPDGTLGLLRVELWHGLAAEEVIETAGRWFLELHEAPVVPLVDAGASPEHGGYLVRRLPGGVSLEGLAARLEREGGALPVGAALALAVALAEVLEALVPVRRALELAALPTLGVSFDGRVYFDAPSLGGMESTSSGGSPLAVDVRAPEELRGRPLDSRTATFRLAAALHRLWTGRPLYEAASDFELLQQARNGDVRIGPLPNELRQQETVLRAALARDPSARPVGPNELAASLVGDADPDALVALLRSVCAEERAHQEELREEIALLAADDVATWPLLRALPPLPAAT